MKENFLYLHWILPFLFHLYKFLGRIWLGSHWDHKLFSGSFCTENIDGCYKVFVYQVVIVQWKARRLANGEVPGSNPDKGDNLLISD